MNKDDIIREFRDAGFEVVEGSHLMHFIDALYRITSNIILEKEPDLSAWDLDSVGGEQLDKIGAFFGIKRKEPTAAYDYTWLNLKVTNLSDAPVEIPPSMKVYSDKMSYHTLNTKSITLNPGQWTTLAFVADEVGKNGNCGIGEINRCDNPNLSVVNLAPVITGSDEESDDSYRYRISKVRYLRMGGNKDAIDAVVRSLPGVSDVMVNIGKVPGTIYVKIYPVYGGYIPGLKDYVNFVIEPFKSAGDIVIVNIPTPKIVYIEGRYRGNDPTNSILEYIKVHSSSGAISVNDIERAGASISDEIYIDKLILYDIDKYGELRNPIYVGSVYSCDDCAFYTTIDHIRMVSV